MIKRRFCQIFFHNTRFFAAILALILFLAGATTQPFAEPVELVFPAYWEKPSYDFSRNPLTREGIELGRQLFYDPVLSRDSTVSCASCHLSFTAFTHVDHALSHGIEDRIGRRNSPALMNLAWAKSFMWDGAIHHLDFQALAPISDSTEMDHSIQQVVEHLSASPKYAALFGAAFGERNITGERVLKAIAQFELTLISANSKYDRVISGKDTFTAQEQNGYRIFQTNCARCHVEPLFTHFNFEKNGLPLDTFLNDVGRMRITQHTGDSLKFKVPTLRNIEFSAPYMHDGRFRKLREVLNFYGNSPAFQGQITLSPDDKTDLTAFLLTLSDKNFLFNPEFSFPKN
jgi:cytochrome c peroxidase